MVGDDEFSGPGGIQAEASSTQAPHLLNALSLSASTGTSLIAGPVGPGTWMQDLTLGCRKSSMYFEYLSNCISGPSEAGLGPGMLKTP